MSSAYALRPASPGDIPALVSIDELNPSAWSANQFEQAFSAEAQGGEEIRVAHKQLQVDGFIVFARVLDEVSIHNIAVRAACQRTGLGGLLLESLLTQARRDGLCRCLLEVRASNTPAQRLYEKYGFTLDGERKHYYPGDGARENALLMSKQL